MEVQSCTSNVVMIHFIYQFTMLWKKYSVHFELSLPSISSKTLLIGKYSNMIHSVPHSRMQKSASPEHADLLA